MDVVECVRVAMRRRMVPGVIEELAYQRQGYDAPEKVGSYIRETVMEYSRVEDSQRSELVTVLCEYDVFVKRTAFPNVTGKISELVGRMLDEFNLKNQLQIPVDFSGWNPCVSAAISRYHQESIREERELFHLPFMVYVEVHINSGR